MTIFDDHKTIALEFSGGKDSTALLYWARPYLEKIIVLFGDTGAVYPHVTKYVVETCLRLGAKLQIINPSVSVLEWIKQEGLPADMLPIEDMREIRPYVRDRQGPLVQSYMKCCSQNIFAPLNEAVKAIGATAVLRGSKKSDSRVGAPDGFIEDGITYYSPLWTWSDADVLAYVQAQGASLPDHYATVNDSLDCWCCTAHLRRHGKAKAQYTAKHYPELWTRIKPSFQALYDATTEDRFALASILPVGNKR